MTLSSSPLHPTWEEVQASSFSCRERKFRNGTGHMPAGSGAQSKLRGSVGRAETSPLHLHGSGPTFVSATKEKHSFGQKDGKRALRLCRSWP